MNVRNIPSQRRRDVMVAAACGVFVAAMVGAAYAAVPLYNWFCRTTGFGGTTQVATAAPSHVLDRKLKVRFDANVAGGLPWRFEPEQNSIEVKVGEVVTVGYRVVNESVFSPWSADRERRGAGDGCFSNLAASTSPGHDSAAYHPIQCLQRSDSPAGTFRSRSFRTTARRHWT
jgi:hypothetical protein